MVKLNHYQVLYFYVFISSIAIVAFLYKGQVYSRYPIPDFANNGTDPFPFQNDTDQWPFKMNLGMMNYVCTIPASNFHVTEKELIDAWNLPPKTRLSPIMREIACCRLAANQLALKSDQFDINNCYCVDSWLSKLFWIAIFGIVFWICAIIFDFPTALLRNTARGPVKAILITSIPLFVWTTAEDYSYFYCDSDIDLWYTIYGDMFPTNYYQKSESWIFIDFAINTNFWACLLANGVAIVETSFFIMFKLVDWLNPDPEIDAIWFPKNQKIPEIKIDAAITKNTNQITMNIEHLKSTHV